MNANLGNQTTTGRPGSVEAVGLDHGSGSSASSPAATKSDRSFSTVEKLDGFHSQAPARPLRSQACRRETGLFGHRAQFLQYMAIEWPVSGLAMCNWKLQTSTLKRGSQSNVRSMPASTLSPNVGREFAVQESALFQLELPRKHAGFQLSTGEHPTDSALRRRREEIQAAVADELLPEVESGELAFVIGMRSVQ